MFCCEEIFSGSHIAKKKTPIGVCHRGGKVIALAVGPNCHFHARQRLFIERMDDRSADLKAMRSRLGRARGRASRLLRGKRKCEQEKAKGFGKQAITLLVESDQ